MTMKTAWSMAVLAAVGLAACLAALTGCDNADSATKTVSVEPTTATIKPGNSVTFTASGGYEYHWSLQAGKEAWGLLSTLTGPTVTYTSVYDPGSNSTALQVLTVVSTLPDMHRAETNPVPNTDEFTAEAYITHLSSNSTVVVP